MAILLAGVCSKIFAWYVRPISTWWNERKAFSNKLGALANLAIGDHAICIPSHNSLILVCLVHWNRIWQTIGFIAVTEFWEVAKRHSDGNRLVSCASYGLGGKTIPHADKKDAFASLWDAII